MTDPLHELLAGSATTASSTTSSVLTVDDIKKAVGALESLPPEPFGQMMTEAGMPPEAGYELHLPFLLKDQFPFAPNYVKFSRAVHKPTILPSLNIGTFKYV